MNIPERGRGNRTNHDLYSATPEEFVKKFGGTRTINKVLIANNGIAAVKCMRSIRRWSYEVFRDDRAIKFVVMVCIHLYPLSSFTRDSLSLSFLSLFLPLIFFLAAFCFAFDFDSFYFFINLIPGLGHTRRFKSQCRIH